MSSSSVSLLCLLKVKLQLASLLMVDPRLWDAGDGDTIVSTMKPSSIFASMVSLGFFYRSDIGCYRNTERSCICRKCILHN